MNPIVRNGNGAIDWKFYVNISFFVVPLIFGGGIMYAQLNAVEAAVGDVKTDVSGIGRDMREMTRLSEQVSTLQDRGRELRMDISDVRAKYLRKEEHKAIHNAP